MNHFRSDGVFSHIGPDDSGQQPELVNSARLSESTRMSVLSDWMGMIGDLRGLGASARAIALMSRRLDQSRRMDQVRRFGKPLFQRSQRESG